MKQQYYELKYENEELQSIIKETKETIIVKDTIIIEKNNQIDLLTKIITSLPVNNIIYKIDSNK